MPLPQITEVKNKDNEWSDFRHRSLATHGAMKLGVPHTEKFF